MKGSQESHLNKHPEMSVGSRGKTFYLAGLKYYKNGQHDFAYGCFDQAIKEEKSWGIQNSVIIPLAKSYMDSITRNGNIVYRKPKFSITSVTGNDNSTLYPAPSADNISGMKNFSFNRDLSEKSILSIYILDDFSVLDPSTFEAELNKDMVLPIGFATCIADGIFITARHLFNGRRPSSFVFYNSNLRNFFKFNILEDRSPQTNLDCIIGQLVPLHGIKTFPPSLRMTSPPSSPCQITLFHSNELMTASFFPPNQPNLQFIGNFSTEQGYCGLPYLNSEGRMFALHCKQSFSPLMTGLSFSCIGVPLNCIAESSAIIKSMTDDSIVMVGSQRPIVEDNQFPLFTTANNALEERDEKGERRSVLGDTPPVKNWGNAVQNVLLRFFKNGKAQFRHSITINTKKVEFIISMNTLVKPPVLSITDFSGKPVPLLITTTIQKSFPDVPSLIPDVSFQKCWWVSVYEGPQSVQRKFVPLINNGVNLIQMGHKIPAICFWRHGANSDDKQYSYKSHRLEEIDKNNPTRKPKKDPGVVKEKLAKIDKDPRFTKYKIAGCQSWGENNGISPYIKEFMQNDDGTNYTFQTGKFNKSQSGKEKQKYGRYRQSAPNGYAWNVSADGESYSLVPAADNKDHYRSFDHLPQEFQIKLNGNWVPLNDPIRVGLPKNLEGSAAPDFYPKLGTHFELRIDRQKLTPEQEKGIHKTLNSTAQSVKYNRNNQGFFEFSRQLAPSSKKHATRTIEFHIKYLDDLNNVMKPK